MLNKQRTNPLINIFSFLQDNHLPAILTFLFAIVACLLILITTKWHGRFSFDHLEGVQKLHVKPTPRIGGLAIMAALGVGVLLLDDEPRVLLRNLFVLGFIVFSFGFIEDITKKVSVALRLWASFMPAILGYLLLGITLRNIGFAPVDYLLQFNPVAIVFTAFAVGGVTHAINIVDGLNGLCAWISIWALIAIIAIAVQVNDQSIALVSLITIGAILGFLVFNWPLGKIFLGDGGSYLLGLCVAWISVLMAVRNSEISPFAFLLICTYPVTEVLYSIYRRRRSRQSPGLPDQLHLHQLFIKSFVSPYFNFLSNTSKNSLGGFLLSLLMILPGMCAAIFYQQAPVLLLVNGLFVLAYLALYWWCFYRSALKLGMPIKGSL